MPRALLATTLFLLSCAHPTALREYPKRAIDRPYLLPRDLSQWNTQIAVSQSSFYFYPLIWEHRVSDTLGLVWSPFPLDLKLGFHESEKRSMGMRFSFLGAGFANAKSFLWRPAITYTSRSRISKGGAFFQEAFFQPELGRNLDKSFAYSAGVELTLLHQLSDPLAIGPLIALVLEKGNPGSRYFNDAPSDSLDSLKTRLPLGIVLDWSFSGRWNLKSQYAFHRLGYAAGFQSHQWLNTLVYSY